MNGIKAVETLSGSVSAESTLAGSISCNGGLAGKLSVTQECEAYIGNYKVVPQAFNEQVLLTAHKVLAEDVTISKVPYWETGNTSNGMTAYIAKEV